MGFLSSQSSPEPITSAPMDTTPIPNETERQEITQIFNDNKGLNFVQRLINPNKDYKINNPDGSISTHLMSHSEIDNGKAIVYPEIVEKDGKLTKLSSKDAYDYARKTKEYILFNNVDKAAWFAENYKKGTIYNEP